MADLNLDDLDSLIENTADLLDDDMTDFMLSALDDPVTSIKPEPNNVKTENAPIYSSSSSSTSTSAPIQGLPFLKVEQPSAQFKAVLKPPPITLNNVKVQPPPLPAPTTYFNTAGMQGNMGQQFIINNGQFTMNKGPPTPVTVNTPGTLKRMIPGGGLVNVNGPSNGPTVLTMPNMPSGMMSPNGMVQLIQSPLTRAPNMSFAPGQFSMGTIPMRKPIYVPLNLKNLCDVSVKPGKTWPKYLATVRNEISITSPQLWSQHFQLLQMQKAQGNQEGKDAPELKAFVTTEPQFDPITVHASGNKKDHVGTLSSTEATNALIPLLQEKLIQINLEVSDPSNSLVNMRIFVTKKAITTDPFQEMSFTADIDIMDANNNNNNHMTPTIASPQNPEQRRSDIKRIYFKKLFEFLDKQKPRSREQLAKARRFPGNVDVTDSRVYEDEEENLSDLDDDLDVDEYISVGDNSDAPQIPGQNNQEQQLEQIYESMTQTVEDNDEEEQEEKDASGSDSDFSSSEDEEYYNKKKRKKKSKAVEISTPEILCVDLRNYQKTALKWMLDREKQGKNSDVKNKLNPLYQERTFPDATKYFYSALNGILTLKFIPAPPDPRGGILADEMGLGKTVEVIALIASNRLGSNPSTQPNKERKYVSKATLVVTPLTIVDQWKSEIERYTSPPLKVYVYQGSRRIKDIQTLLTFDVIITTYNTLAFEFGKTFTDGGAGKRKNAANAAANPNSDKKEISPMYQLQFYRVVLDEAHNIKNRKSQQSRASSAVDANRRWAVTGTPIQNDIDDLFSLFHFLKVTPHGDWRWWSKYIGKPFEKKDKKASEALSLVISELLIRRTKNKKVNGQTLVRLPPKKISTMELIFTDAEQLFYKSLYEYAKSKFDEFVQSGTVLKNYANILEMLLHLRQVCDHPALIITSFQKKNERSTMKGFLEDFVQKTDFQIYDQILPMLPEVLKINARVAKSEQDKTQLALNSGAMNNATLSSDSDSEDDYDFVKDEFGASVPVLKEKIAPVPATTTTTTTTTDKPVKTPRVGKKKQEAIDKGLIDVKEYMTRKWRTSTKITALCDYVNKIKHSEKSVVFSQWTSMLNLVEIALKRAKIGCVRLDGSMQRKDREIAVSNFKNDPDLAVCLISLKVGGVGLNLVWATHVFLLDPWWNPAIEDQAIDRVHRIGQDKPVTVVRFVIKNSVEERIVMLQKSKSTVAKNALDGSTHDENENEEGFVNEERDEDDPVEDDEDDYTAVDLDADDDSGFNDGGFGMTKKDAKVVRVKDLEKLFMY